MNITDPVRRNWHRRANLPVKHADVRLAQLGVPSYLDADSLTAFNKWMAAHVAGQVEDAGVGLLIVGDPGFGKTTMACGILNEIVRFAPKNVLGHTPQAGFSMIRPVLFTEYATYLTTKRQVWKLEQQGLIDTEEFNKGDVLCEGIEGVCLNDAWNARYLVLDDVGKEHTSSSHWAENVLDEVLRHRFNRGFVTVITTNKIPELWDASYSPSMRSFVREAFIEVGVLGKDRR